MKSNFKIILIVIFIFFAVFGIFVFSGSIPIGGDKGKIVAQGIVVLWGTVKNDIMSPLIQEFNNVNTSFTVKYVQKSPDSFDRDLLEALAGGVGPDMFLLPDDLAYSYSNKIFTTPYSSYPLASFKNNYAQAGDVFLTSKGVLAFPISIDPLMMYYNRTALNNNNIVYPPAYWDEFIDLTSLFTIKDSNKQIVKSAVALGQFSNITNAKDILVTLFTQAGSAIVKEDKGFYRSDLDEFGTNKSENLGPILSFYTSFADPLKENYSWNRSLPMSLDFFSAEKTVFYFGFASELKTLINKNPNQNLAVAQMPQIKNVDSSITSARVTGIAISSFSKNFNTALIAAGLLSSGDFAQKFSDALGVVPARRDLLAKKPIDDAHTPAFYSSALISKSWLDPSKIDTDNIFRNMINNVLSNNMTPKEAIVDANGKMHLLLIK